ncbi:hypothetical protein C7974DRAFT_376744 [Boeremia exigua]|uniref:uncharacterized protein n=1 Tax=Boeremia exigua TaxID=749465 RepID=UPI001E8D55EF|nr:uncharacterized protein C7974DRAFT_376744 [Boeremia exigua]KAH6625191.1 hypothetical protein C7974DRAFT_376744 [Boeremia exigua]
MAPIEFHRYLDARGDTIIYKFDPDVARRPDPSWPNDSAVSVYHYYAINRHINVNYHSDLLPLDLAVERWRNDKQSSQPAVGMVMYKEDSSGECGYGNQMKTQYIWRGWGHGEGYRRGWAKLSVLKPPANDFSFPPEQDSESKSSVTLENPERKNDPRSSDLPPVLKAVKQVFNSLEGFLRSSIYTGTFQKSLRQGQSQKRSTTRTHHLVAQFTVVACCQRTASTSAWQECSEWCENGPALATISSDESENERQLEIEDADNNFANRGDGTNKSIRYDGKFAFITQSDHPHNPGLFIKGLGTVGLPLSIRDAKAIASVSKKSPFGKGDETLVDESVRKTWDLDLTEFECCNPKWQFALQQLVSQAIQGLGVQAPGMFGTLVVCLPSEHTGGEVRLVHASNERTLETAHTSAFDLTVLAWYSDVQHEIKPVTSGHRLVLTYNLVQDQPQPQQSAATLDQNMSKFEQTLQAWSRRHIDSEYLVYPLEHKYTADLSLQSLKGPDAAKGLTLAQLCNKNGIYWFLARMTEQSRERNYYGGVYGEEEEEEEEEEVSFLLRDAKLPSGLEIPIFISPVDPASILADMDHLHGDRAADSEDEGEYTGNENMPATFRYHDSVLVMMRRDDLFRRISSAHGDMCSDRTWGKEPCTGWYIVRRPYIAGMVNYNRPREAGLKYVRLFDLVSELCHTNNMSQIIGEELRSVIINPAWTESPELFGMTKAHIARELSIGKEDVWTSWLETPISPASTYTSAKVERCALDVIDIFLPSASIPAFKEWKIARLNRVVRTVTLFSMEDAGALLYLIPYIAQDTYLETVIPVIQGQVHRESLLHFLQLVGANDSIPFELVVKPAYERLADAATEVVKLRAEDLISGHNSAHLNNVLTLIDNYLRFGLPREATRLIIASLPDVPNPMSTEWSNWRPWFDLLSRLAGMISWINDPTLADSTRPFIISVIDAVLGHSGRSRPQEPRDWARRPQSYVDRPGGPYSSRSGTLCTCQPCQAMAAFISSPTQIVARFTYTGEVRKYLENFAKPYEEYVCTTDRSAGTSYTLAKQKIHHFYHKSLAQWQNDAAEMNSRLIQIDSIFPLAHAGIAAANLASPNGGGVQVQRALQPLSFTSFPTQDLRAPAPMAGTKRTIDGLCLTGG